MKDQQIKFLGSLVSDDSPREVLSSLADYVLSTTAADGIKIFLLNKNTQNQPILERVYSSTTQKPYNRILHSVKKNKGLAEWCLHNQQWLLIESRDGNVGDAEACSIGPNNDATIRTPIYETQASENDEKSLVVFPLYADMPNPFYGDKLLPIGVFSIWSAKTQFFNVKQIDQWLKNCAQYISKASNKYLTLKYKAIEEKIQFEIPQLFFAPDHQPDVLKSIPQIHTRFLQLLAQVMPVQHLVLFEQDYHFSHIIKSIAQLGNKDGNKADNKATELEQRYAAFHVEDNNSTLAWGKLTDEIAQVKNVTGVKIRASLVRPEFTEGSSIGLAIFDCQSAKIEQKCMFFHACQFQSMARLLKQWNDNLEIHLESFVRQWIRILNDKVNNRKKIKPLWILEQTIEIIHKATQAQTLVYDRDYKAKVVASYPIKENIHDNIASPESLTAKAIATKKTISIFDVNKTFDKKPKLHQKQLEELKQGLGWSHILSWQIAPITSYANPNDQTVLGIYKILTRDAYLSAAHMTLIQAIAEWAFYHYRQYQKNKTLTALNQMSNELAAHLGETLTKAAEQKIAHWLDAYIRVECDFLFIARTASGIVLNSGCSAAMLNHKQAFIDYSLTLNNEHSQLPPDVLRPLKLDKLLGKESWPFQVQGDPDFMGRLFVLSTKRFSPQQTKQLQELTQELSIVFCQEKLQHQWRAETGIFRHSVISPIQGLVGVNEQLMTLAEKHEESEPDKIRKYRARSKRYQAQIRNWRAYQRLEVDGHIDIHPTVQALKPLLQEWISRAEAEARANGIHLRFEKPQGAIEFLFEVQALDITFNNLLDNAIKYSPPHSCVTIKAYVQHHWVYIAIENQCADIPKKVQDRLFEFGQRNANMVNNRAIPGQGIGLTLAKALTEAHEQGRLAYMIKPNPHASYQDGADAAIIRFDISLPHHRRT